MTMVCLDSEYIKHDGGGYMNPLFQRNYLSSWSHYLNPTFLKGCDIGMWW